MASNININLRCDMNSPVKMQYLDGSMFTYDNGGNTINVDVFDKGVPVTITGDVTANVIRADGGTVVVTGDKSSNRAFVILPQAAYNVPGAVTIVIKVAENSTVMTIAALTAMVYPSKTATIVST